MGETSNSRSNSSKGLGDKWKRVYRKSPPPLHTKKGKDGQEKHQRRCTFAETTDKVGLQSSTGQSPFGQDDTHKPQADKWVFRPGMFSLFFGVVLPIAALAVETNTHMLAKMAFDPFPSLAHVFLFLLIPVSNFLTWLSVRRDISSLYSMMALSSGMALGIGILYTLMLLPQTPTFLIMSIFGIGLLGLAPVLSIFTTVLCGQTICKLADSKRTYFDAHQLKHLGHLIILVMVIVVELPSTLTRMHLSQADSGSAETQKNAIDWLRHWGDKEVLLRACYEHSGKATDILGSLAEHQHPVSVEQARQIYYRVTGVSFNAVPIPASFRGTIQHAGLISDPAGLNADVKDEFDLDPDIAGELVSGVARGLSVSQSTLEGSVNREQNLASLDWTFTFENVSDIAREARAKILLPPGAVVTSATLWLDDYQKETTIMSRGLARETYQAAVKEHKQDPLLISMAGKDTVLVQCYPVQKGTVTKIRLHILSPLEKIDGQESALVLPTFDERNFAITIPHKVALNSNWPIEIAGAKPENNQKSISFTKPAIGSFTAGGDMDNALFSRFNAIAHVKSKDSSPASKPAAVSKAKIKKGLTIIVDQSVTMAPYMKEIIEGLRTAPDGAPITIYSVLDDAQLVTSGFASSDKAYSEGLDVLAKSECRGGQPNGDVVLQAIAPNLHNDTLWIHAAQPVADRSQSLISYALGTPRESKLFDLQVASGPNAYFNESYNYFNLDRVSRAGSLKSDLSRFLQSWGAGKFQHNEVTLPSPRPDKLDEASQLAAYNKSMELYMRGDKFHAYTLAQQYHLVTPVSSAVVADDIPLKVKPQTAAKNESHQPELMNFLKQGQDLGALPQEELAQKKPDISRLFNTSIHEAEKKSKMKESYDAPMNTRPLGKSMEAMPMRAKMDAFKTVAADEEMAEAGDKLSMSDSRQYADRDSGRFAYPSSSPAPAAAPEPPVGMANQKQAFGGKDGSAYPTEVFSSQTYDDAASNKPADAKERSRNSEQDYAKGNYADNNSFYNTGVATKRESGFRSFGSIGTEGEAGSAGAGGNNAYYNPGQELSAPGSPPALQGATNGTVGGGMFDGVTSQLNSLSSAAGSANSGMVGAPIDPRYGQSNEAGSYADAGAVYKKTQNFFLAMACTLILMVVLLVAVLTRLVSKKVAPESSSSWDDWKNRNN